MSSHSFISIDQNSTPLWDTLPKLQALHAHGWKGFHYIEDIDTAFTRRGAGKDTSDDLLLAPEKLYRDSTSDWGAALFYTDFLGRNPCNPRDLEPHTGLSTKALARQLGLSMDQLYEQYADSDNLQLIGCSFLFNRSAHRVIGDLEVKEIMPFLRQLMESARKNLEHTFPDTQCRRRTREWFDQELSFLHHAADDEKSSPLTELYRKWLRRHLPSAIRLQLTSDKFSALSPPGPLLRLFLQDYDKASELYNLALKESGSELTPLKRKKGELPFFAVWHRRNRKFRTPLFLQEGRLSDNNQFWCLNRQNQPPLEEMRKHGLIAIAGKALILVLEARDPDAGAPLVLPEHGSLYMPTAYVLEKKLRQAGIIANGLHPVHRLKMNFLARLKELEGTVFRPPSYIQNRLGEKQIDLAEFASMLPEIKKQAERELQETQDPEKRKKWSQRLYPELNNQLQAMEDKRRLLAANPETRAQASELWELIKTLKTRKLKSEVQRLIDNTHISRIDYWNSRGAIMPWSIAAGGKDFYRQVLEKAEITKEQMGTPD